MNAIITGITGLRNRGVEALVVPIIEQLHQRRPDLAIDVLSCSPEYDEIRLQPLGVKPIHDYLRSNNSRRLQKLQTNLSHFHKPLSPGYQSNLEKIRKASIVIASGGDVFSSDYGALKRHLLPLELALNADVPVVFLAQSIGPFKTTDEAEAWLKVARRSKLVTVRERLSYNYVTKDLGLDPSLVKHTADPAFLLRPPSQEIVAKMLINYGIELDRPKIAIAPSQAICRYAVQDYEKHIDVWSKVVKLMVNEFEAQVLIIPHVQEINPNNNDLLFATQLLKALDYNPQVRLAGADHTASEFKGLIGACDMVVAERMHPAIAGLSSGVCTMPVGYSVKAEGIMTDLLGSEALHDGLLISIQQFLNVDIACEAIINSWKKRHEVVNQLSQILPQAKQAAAFNFDMVFDCLEQKDNK
ncbi:polysaccharide pyruvyl transferase family protein [Nostoc sp. LEGE 06077]|uniref:polysaccharide pyruvyl transferase family protein n=1 Tax=Nostoc sp. LEGE 06077 TaxID=915325 RepID=UPI00187E1F67|nr:polysaccharide pyruvyl transferase family protein [Nostoc sp. LEGE 06077]MBE9209869.1 polysaccharide pyruvyl transferase family protein [Nostoc sp. LEGE 06077]